jgi:hypothetical protein
VKTRVQAFNHYQFAVPLPPPFHPNVRRLVMKSLILVAFLWHQQGLAHSTAAVEGDVQECIEDTGDDDTTNRKTYTIVVLVYHQKQ